MIDQMNIIPTNLHEGGGLKMAAEWLNEWMNLNTGEAALRASVGFVYQTE